jgi:HSP20 family protein
MKKDLTLFNDFWEDMPSLFEKGRKMFSGFSNEFDKILNGKCDFEELDDKYLVELEVPGVKKDEINLNLKNDVLTISWSRKREEKNEKSKRKHYERSEGSFTRSFNVEGADSNKIDASLKEGILKIVLPKHEEAKSKKIEIK